jgi:hypothetical protein
MGEGCCQMSQTMVFEIRPASSTLKIFESLFFSTSVNFKAFSDKYFVVKFHSLVMKLIVEFNSDSKTGLGSKIRTPSFLFRFDSFPWKIRYQLGINLFLNCSEGIPF